MMIKMRAYAQTPPHLGMRLIAIWSQVIPYIPELLYRSSDSLNYNNTVLSPFSSLFHMVGLTSFLSADIRPTWRTDSPCQPRIHILGACMGDRSVLHSSHSLGCI